MYAKSPRIVQSAILLGVKVYFNDKRGGFNGFHNRVSN